VLERLRAVHAVTRCAGQIPPLVHATLPGRVIATVVARQADLVDLTGFHLRELLYVSARLVFDVRLPGAVTALAPLCRRGRSRVLRLTVGRSFERVSFIGVTLQALIRSNIAAGLRGC